MLKFDRDIRKRWLSFVLLNMIIIMLVFGTILAVYGVVTTNANNSAIAEELKQYSLQLKQYPLEKLEDYCDGKSQNIDIIHPTFSFGIYIVRGDNSYAFKSKNDFLEANSPSIGGKLDTIANETIGEYRFITYTTSISNISGAYIKVFVSNEYMIAAEHDIIVNNVIFCAVFIIMCVVISVVLGYIEIRPITENYYKQKSFINDMSHEIRTPLAIIKGNLENVLASPDAKVNLVKDDIEECINEVDYMTNMSTGLLDIAHAENRKAKKDTILSDAIAESVDLFADVAAMSNKSLLARIDYCPMVVDKEKIKQLVSILIENSLKFTTDGDRINVKLKNANGMCSLIVADTGIGVDKSELDKIFDRFYRGENSKEIQGTGLGLSIAKSLVDSMNGTIKANQNIPSGLEIVVTFKVG